MGWLRLLAACLPWRVARWLFKPALGPGQRDRLLDRLGFWRSLVGLAVVVVASLNYQTPVQSFWDTGVKMYLTGLWGSGGALLSLLVLLVLTRSGLRRQLAAAALRWLWRVGFLLACYALIVGVFFLFGGFFTLLDGTDYIMPWLGGVLAAIVYALWSLAFVPCTVYWAARTSFWAADIHPLLPPVATVALTLGVTGHVTSVLGTNGVPVPLWLGLNLCGIISTLILACFEYRHLRSIGYRFRNGPGLLPDRPNSESETAGSDQGAVA